MNSTELRTRFNNTLNGLGRKPDYEKTDRQIMKVVVVAGIIGVLLLVWWHSREECYRFMNKCDARVERFWRGE